MIFTERELKEAIDGKDIYKYLHEKGYKYVELGKGEKRIFYIEDKLKFKSINAMEEVIKQHYKITDVVVIDKTIKLVKELYEEDRYINVEEFIIKDRELVNLLVEYCILTVTEYCNYRVGVSYRFLAKILEI